LPLAIRGSYCRIDLTEFLESFDLEKLPGKQDDSYLTAVQDIPHYGTKLTVPTKLREKFAKYCKRERKSFNPTLWQCLIVAGKWHPSDPSVVIHLAPRTPRIPVDLSATRLRVNHLGWYVLENPEVDGVLFLRTPVEKQAFLKVCGVDRPELVKEIPYRYAYKSIKGRRLLPYPLSPTPYPLPKC
jgi:hypothetical protein